MNILVTGGLGFVGSHLVDLLVQDFDNNVTVIDDLSSESSSDSYRNPMAEYHIADIRNINKGWIKYHFEKLRKFDVIYHLAARARIQPSFKNPAECFDIDARGTCEVLEFARNQGAKVVYAGSSSAYGGPKLNPYAFSKYTGEELCILFSQIYDMSTVIARFFNVYGDRHPRSGQYATVVGIFEKQMMDGDSLTVTGTGKQRRDFTHVSDIVSGFKALAYDEYKGQILNLGTGINHSINELAHLFKDDITWIPKRPGEAWTTLADIKMAKELLDWEPRIKFIDGIDERKISSRKAA